MVAEPLAAVGFSWEAIAGLPVHQLRVDIEAYAKVEGQSCGIRELDCDIAEVCLVRDRDPFQ